MYKSFRTRIKPKKREKEWLLKQLEFQTTVWNWLVEEYNPIIQDCIDNKKPQPKFSSIEQKVKQVFAYEYSQDWCGTRIGRGAIVKYQQAWKRVWTVKKGTKSPHTKDNTKPTQSLYVPDLEIKIMGDGFGIHSHRRIGWQTKTPVRIKDKYILDFYYDKNCVMREYTILFENEKIYAILCFSFKEHEIFPSKKQQIGLDWGVKHFLTSNTGECFDYPERLIRLDKKRRRMISILETKEKGSNNYNKLSKKISKIVVKEKNIRRNWIHKTVHYLLTNYNLICIEKLNMQQLLYLNKTKPAMQRKMKMFPFGLFRDLLIQQSKYYTCVVLEIDQKECPSTQICCNCGNKQKKKLEQRTVQCPICGNNIDRDQNAAINLLKYGQKKQNRLENAEK